MIPPIGSLIGQLFVGWNSGRTGSCGWHAAVPILIGAVGGGGDPRHGRDDVAEVGLFTLAMAGLKAYLPAFWALPSLLLTAEAAAAAIGLVNSLGNLGGWAGPWLVGSIKGATDSYDVGLWVLAGSMTASALIVARLAAGLRLADPRRAARRDSGVAAGRED